VEQCGYLRSAIYLPADIKEMIKDRLNDCGRPTTWSLTTEAAEHFVDCFTERLAQVGFDSEYKLTSEGTMLEELIDRFSE
jgi:hypothetical protein